jgi:hypothetical protein
MATTTNYSWSTPDDTALVKDGAAAIRTLGSSADTTVKALNPGTTAGDIDYYTTSTAKARVGIGTAGQVLKVNSGATAPEWGNVGASGLTLITSQTIGSAVASVTVTSVFSSTYDNYRIIITGGVGSSASEQLQLKLGATTTGYYRFAIFGNFSANTVNGERVNNGANWQGVGTATTNQITASMDLLSPNLAKQTTVLASHVQSDVGGNVFWFNGLLNDTTQYTDFTITPSAGTLTGGTIRVYGYQNS